MKKVITIFLFALITLPAWAQDDLEGAQLDPKAKEKIQAARIAYITERLALTPDEAEKFWPVYREYAQKRLDLRQEFREARKNGKDEKALLDLDLKIKQQELDLEKDYSGRLQKVITPQKLMNLRQAEGDFRKLLLRQIQQRQLQQEKRDQMRDRQQQRLQQRNN
ncbi:MAG: hypothetical protein JNM57_02570 [Cyclobacteriaceae bacterium]|nr:hypothetical protein [Cyclobacteriaceae bacterium]